MKKCPYCNTLNPDDAEVCENCGKPLKGQMLILVYPNCGKVNALGSRECSVCHTKLSQSNHQLVSREITPRKNNKRWGYMALCPVKYTDQLDKNFRRLDCGIVPRSSRFCLCKRVWY